VIWRLTTKSCADVCEIVAEMNTGKADETTKKRVARSWVYIKDNGVFPNGLVTMKKPDGPQLLTAAATGQGEG
jgi:hypothetical protein